MKNIHINTPDVPEQIIARLFNDNSQTTEDLKNALQQHLGWTIINRKIANSLKTVDPRITHACDHACPHCWANLYGKHMSMDTFEKVLDLADEAGIHVIQFTGGEPTLNRDMVKMARRAKERGFELILRTHGRHMPRVHDSEAGTTWAESIAAVFDEVIVSIDGTAAANFRMRPVARDQKLLHKVSLPLYEDRMQKTAQRQFDETVAGYEALTRAIGDRKDISLKINTVVAKANVEDMAAFGEYLSRKAGNRTFRIDQWDITQVFASPESTAEERESYAITEETFWHAVLSAALSSPNVAKRAKAQTSDRCLIVDESGRTYIGGESNHELGSLNQDSPAIVNKGLQAYKNINNLTSERIQKYMQYTTETENQ